MAHWNLNIFQQQKADTMQRFRIPSLSHVSIMRVFIIVLVAVAAAVCLRLLFQRQHRKPARRIAAPNFSIRRPEAASSARNAPSRPATAPAPSAPQSKPRSFRSWLGAKKTGFSRARKSEGEGFGSLKTDWKKSTQGKKKQSNFWISMKESVSAAKKKKTA
jgi:hypothetical protein